MQPMVVDKRTARLGFAQRLGEALTRAGIPDDHTRRSTVAKRYGVSQESVRKWIKGESMPDTARIEGFARDLNCDASWLLTGEGAARKLPDYGFEYAQPPPSDHLLIRERSNALDKMSLLTAVDRADMSGALTPELAAGIAALLNKMSEAAEQVKR